MANNVKDSSAYIDTTANSIVTGRVKVIYVLFTPTSASGSVLLLDGSAGAEFLRFQGATSGDSKLFDFSRMPVVLTDGIHATVTNGKATVIYEKVGG